MSNKLTYANGCIVIYCADCGCTIVNVLKDSKLMQKIIENKMTIDDIECIECIKKEKCITCGK